MTEQPATQPAPAPTGRLVVATIVALVAATALLVVAVLPAEYGIDPTGLGDRMGLTAMATPGAVVELTSMSDTANTTESPLLDSPRAYNENTVSYTLPPGGWVEYKFALGQGATFLYQWEATGPVTFDFHTEPVGTGAAGSESFSQGSATAEDGSYRAPYSGYHGWYWLNEGDAPVEINLTAVGYFTQAREYREDGSTTDYDLRPDTP
jgi:hypothetical protein